MKALLGTMLFALAAQAYAQALEADLDGNASALQASELRPAPQPRKEAKKGVRTLLGATRAPAARRSALQSAGG
jgi:hypothetical protein